MTAERGPMPPNGSGMRKPKSARLGMVCKILVKPKTGRCKNLRRVNNTPTGMPIATAHAIASATSNRCSPTSVNRSRQLCAMNSNRFIPTQDGLERFEPSRREDQPRNHTKLHEAKDMHFRVVRFVLLRVVSWLIFLPLQSC